MIGKILFFIFENIGAIEPLLPKTFPYLTTLYLISLLPFMLFAEMNSLSEHSLVAPYKFIGEDALSVDKATTFVFYYPGFPPYFERPIY